MSDSKDQNDENNKYTSKLELGMILGIIFGGLMGTLFFVFTQNPISYIAIGVFLVIGLMIGQLYDNKNQKGSSNS